MRQKFGLIEQGSTTSRNAPTPLFSSSSHNKCPHCENMAKNFLYLESLIRSNYNPKDQCNLCFSSLKYLQYVNKSISQVFGNFDSIVQAAQATALPSKSRSGFKIGKSRSRLSKGHGSTLSAYSATIKKHPSGHTTSKHRLPRKKSRISKLNETTSKRGRKPKIRSRLTLPRLPRLPRPRSTKTASKNSLKKGKKKSRVSSNNSSFDSSAKFRKSSKSDAKLKTKSTSLLRGLKQKSVKTRKTLMR